MGPSEGDGVDEGRDAQQRTQNPKSPRESEEERSALSSSGLARMKGEMQGGATRAMQRIAEELQRRSAPKAPKAQENRRRSGAL